jgi:hypothetical protein
MATISLKSIMFVVAYAAICSTAYATPNLWAGWLVVLATATWIAISIYRTSLQNSSFSLGFSIAASVWLIAWLGFGIETSTQVDDIPFRTAIYDFVSFGGDTGQEYDPSARLETYSKAHDLYQSFEQTKTQGTNPHVPSWHNAMRLIVCITSLLIGCLGGLATYFGRREGTIA